MPEASIVVTLQDRYSETAKKMSEATKAFTKDVDQLEEQLRALDRNKYELHLQAKSAKQALREAEEQFCRTGDAADGLKAQMANADYSQITRKLNLVKKATRETERAISSLGRTVAAESAGKRISGDLGMGDIVHALGTEGRMGDSLSQVTLNLGTTLAGSLWGNVGGTLAGSTLSSAVSGAAAGFAVSGGNPVGAAIGGALGGGVGMLSGGVQAFQRKDDYFKDYVRTNVEEQWQQQEQSLATGSNLAAQRETDKLSFTTLLGGEEQAETFLSDLVDKSNETPFQYGDLAAMSKTLATYGYGQEELLPTIQTIGDAGADLGHSGSDMVAIATALGQMRSSGKTSLEDLDLLSARGINSVEILADAKGVSQKEMYGMISREQVAGGEAASLILTSMAESFGGAMERQSKTFPGLSSTVEGLHQELDAAMGKGYNETRKQGMTDEINWLSGESGEKMKEANEAIGAWKAKLENDREASIRKAMTDMMKSDAYLTAESDGNAAEMGKLLMEAQIDGINKYNASEGAQLEVEAQKSLIQSVRADAALQKEYWNAGEVMGQEFSKGLASGKSGIQEALAPETTLDEQAPEERTSSGTTVSGKRQARSSGLGWLLGWRSLAVGIDRVPYDNFPALLHEGERVQTAVEARSQREALPGITISGNTLVIREEADVTRVAQELLEQIELAQMRG